MDVVHYRLVSGGVDTIEVPTGTAHQHVRKELIIKVVPQVEHKSDDVEVVKPKQFSMTHLFFPDEPDLFTEYTAPDWLTSKNTIKGSTMDARWFWNDIVIKLKVGRSTKTDFHKITRIA